MSDKRVPLSDLAYDEEEEAAVLRVLRSRWLSAGPTVQQFEEAFAAHSGAASALAVSSATAALHLSLVAVGVRPGDEVIQPAINFVAAANMTVAVGARPVFADVVALNEPILDPDAVERLFTSRTKAVISMYYGGYFGQVGRLLQLCRDRGVPLIEDACHAVGATSALSEGRRAGNIGDIGCFSFFSNKNMATGEGGMITTGRADYVARLRLLRSHGMTTMTWQRDRGHASSYDVQAHGYNYRMDEMRAALGLVQLRKLDDINRRRRAAVASYRRHLRELPDSWTVPFADQDVERSACHLMVVVAPDAESRAAAASTLKEAGIQTSLHYPSIPTFEAFRGYESDVPVSREYGQRTLTLPLYADLAESDIEYVSRTLLDVARRTATSPPSPR